MIRTILNSRAVARLLEVMDRRTENRMTELGMLAQAFEFSKINGIEGDYLEFGVWRGKTFKQARRMALRYGCKEVRYKAFDSFQGLPAVERSPYEVWQTGQFACSQAEFHSVLAADGFSKQEYELFPGFYRESLNDALLARFNREGVKAKIVYVDCDLYESTVPVLRFIAQLIQDGTVLCFDDYYSYRGLPGFGEQLAIEEFLAHHPHIKFIPYFPYMFRPV